MDTETTDSPKTSSTKKDVYFVQDEPKELVKRLKSYVEGWNTAITRGGSGIASAWRRNLNHYYANVFDCMDEESGLIFGGEQGELVKVLVPEARTLARQFISLVTKQRLAFQGVCQGSDYDALSNTELVNALNENIIREQVLDRQAEEMVESALIVGAGYLSAMWRTDKGPLKGVNRESAGLLFAGDLEISVPSIFDVMYDVRKKWRDAPWKMRRTHRNRFDLAAQFPHLKDELLKLPSMREQVMGDVQAFIGILSDDDDDVFIYEFFHEETPSVPGGKLVVFGDEDTILYCDKNPYTMCRGKGDVRPYIPITQMAPEGIMGTGLAYPFFSNLIPLQNMLDHTYSAISTNQSAFAVQSILCPRNANVKVIELFEGLNMVEYDPRGPEGGGEPKALQLTQSPPEAFKFLEVLDNKMTQTSFINGTLRGSPPPGVTAASAINTLTTNAIEFMQGFSKSLVLALEEVMRNSVNAYAVFCVWERSLNIVGKNKTSMAKKFFGKDLFNVSMIQLKVTNPISTMPSGKMDLAEKFVQWGFIKNVADFYVVYETGSLETTFDAAVNQEMLIYRENAMLQEGQTPVTLPSDDHGQHYQKHLALLDDPEVRNNPKVLKAVLAHASAHLDEVENQNPGAYEMARTGQVPQQIIGSHIPPPPGVLPPGGQPPGSQPPGSQPPGGQPPPGAGAAPPPHGLPPPPNAPQPQGR